MKHITVFAFILACALALPAHAAGPAITLMPDKVQKFAQDFYDWYPAASEKDKDMSGEELALKQRPAAFSPELLKALQEDLAASAKDPDEVVGLDFDPFLASQDPCKKYQVGKVTAVGDTYQVEVSGICPGYAPHKGPDLIAVLKADKGSWIFVNFIYPADGDTPQIDLLTMLKNLSKDRQK